MYFNANNVFDSWDLNPVAAATGIPRDTLAADRDAFLEPLMAKYRAAANSIGFAAAEDDFSLYNDPAFRAFVQTGALPGPTYRTPAPPATPVSTAAGEQALVSSLAAFGHPTTNTAATASAFRPLTTSPLGGASLGGFDVVTLAALAAVAFGVYKLTRK